MTTIDRWAVVESDVVDALRSESDASFDALLSDVPYGLGNREPTLDELVSYLRGESALNTGGDFMGKKMVSPSVAFWREAMRVLKPGAPLLVFAGTRTQDLISMGMRVAGFEIRDCIDWVYASGFPKSLDVSKAIDAASGATRQVVGEKRAGIGRCSRNGSEFVCYESNESEKNVSITAPATELAGLWDGYGTALKPAREPIILARKPLDGTVAHNAIAHGVAGINVDGCRIGTTERVPASLSNVSLEGFGHAEGRSGQSLDDSGHNPNVGRWPANLAFSHAGGCRPVGKRKVKTGKAHRANGGGNTFGGTAAKPALVDMSYADADGTETTDAMACVDGCPVKLLDEQSGDRPGMSGGGKHRDGYGGGMFGGIDSVGTARHDNGGASRFSSVRRLLVVNVSSAASICPRAKDFEAVDREEGSAGLGPRAGAGGAADEVRNYGPCVKPLSLTRWLATLILPPPRPDGRSRRLLVPYCGTGSEMIGALRAGWEEVVGIQRVSDDEERGYVAIAKARIARWSEVPTSMDEGEAVAASEKPDGRQASLFGGTP